MARVSETLTAETVREGDGSYRFTLVAQRAGLTARSTSTYGSQADALSASARMAEEVEAEVFERDGGHLLRLTSGNLEAVSDPYPDRRQAEAILEALTA